MACNRGAACNDDSPGHNPNGYGSANAISDNGDDGPSLGHPNACSADNYIF